MYTQSAKRPHVLTLADLCPSAWKRLKIEKGTTDTEETKEEESKSQQDPEHKLPLESMTVSRRDQFLRLAVEEMSCYILAHTCIDILGLTKRELTPHISSEFNNNIDLALLQLCVKGTTSLEFALIVLVCTMRVTPAMHLQSRKSSIQRECTTLLYVLDLKDDKTTTAFDVLYTMATTTTTTVSTTVNAFMSTCGELSGMLKVVKSIASLCCIVDGLWIQRNRRRQFVPLLIELTDSAVQDELNRRGDRLRCMTTVVAACRTKALEKTVVRHLKALLLPEDGDRFHLSPSSYATGSPAFTFCKMVSESALKVAEIDESLEAATVWDATSLMRSCDRLRAIGLGDTVVVITEINKECIPMRYKPYEMLEQSEIEIVEKVNRCVNVAVEANRSTRNIGLVVGRVTAVIPHFQGTKIDKFTVGVTPPPARHGVGGVDTMMVGRSGAVLIGDTSVDLLISRAIKMFGKTTKVSSQFIAPPSVDPNVVYLPATLHRMCGNPKRDSLQPAMMLRIESQPSARRPLELISSEFKFYIPGYRVHCDPSQYWIHHAGQVRIQQLEEIYRILTTPENLICSTVTACMVMQYLEGPPSNGVVTMKG
jgi:hypothetical protein